MKKRCNVGDIAIVINDLEMPINNGAIVEIVSAAIPENYEVEGMEWECKAISTIQYFGGGTAKSGERGIGYRDCELLPIRDTDGEDETFGWAGKPEEVTA